KTATTLSWCRPPLSCFEEPLRKCDPPSPHSSCSSSFSSCHERKCSPANRRCSSSIERKCSPSSIERKCSHLTCPIPDCAKQRATIASMRSHLSKEHQKGKGPPKEWLVATDSKLCPKCSKAVIALQTPTCG